MNLKKLPKQKRNQLFMVVLLTVAVLAGLGYGLIKLQYDKLTQLASETDEAERKLEQMQDNIKRAAQLEAELAEVRAVLDGLEQGMAQSDSYSWIINTIRTFRVEHKVDPPQFSPSAEVSEVNLLPRFPYKQARLSLSGTAFYHDLGAFVADFENRFPHIRILNLDVERSPGATTQEQEKLAFRMEIAALVKPNLP
jgi:Tfp pilus assembly protein PilO